MDNFNDLALNHELLSNLTQLGYETPTPIQSNAIPLILLGHDLMGIAQTGTGKTGAFCIPVLELLVRNPLPKKKAEPRVLILTPTRELCLQISGVISSYTQNLKIRNTAVFGGVKQTGQVNELDQGVEILVATPGRLLDLLEQKLLKLSSIEIFIMDEADRMLDMGFIDDIKNIYGRIPSKKQTMLFSATMPKAIENLASNILKNPRKVEVSPASSVAPNIDQKLIYCKNQDKFQLLRKIIKEEAIERVLVFTRTKITAENVVEYLALNRMASKAFHSDMKQAERERALLLFKNGSMKVLVATDIASRGIDIDGISHVINFDLPREAENYVHRIGRTARSGQEGIAISFCDESEVGSLEKIQQKIQTYLPSEKFEGKSEQVKFNAGGRKVTAPTPGKSQEKTAYLDHSKRQPRLKEGEKLVHPGFRNNKKKKRK